MKVYGVVEVLDISRWQYTREMVRLRIGIAASWPFHVFARIGDRADNVAHRIYAWGERA